MTIASAETFQSFQIELQQGSAHLASFDQLGPRRDQLKQLGLTWQPHHSRPSQDRLDHIQTKLETTCCFMGCSLDTEIHRVTLVHGAHEMEVVWEREET